MLTKVLSATALIALTAGAGTAATFNGDTAQFQLDASGLGTIVDTTTTIGAGVEAGIPPQTVIDVDGLSVFINFDLTGTPSVGAETEWRILDLDTDDGTVISSVALVSGNSRLVSDISFTRKSASFSFFDFTVGQSPGSQTWEFAITTAAVPLPASLPLMLLGFGALAMNRRRKAA